MLDLYFIFLCKCAHVSYKEVVGARRLRTIKVLFNTRCCCGCSVLNNKWKYWKMKRRTSFKVVLESEQTWIRGDESEEGR